ncbi:MAG TPA: hypothetical protein VNB90_09680 [Cytophagaceae bacterium]|nr:hypothetical protein [Cytophagaceae bacterium]
MDMATAVMAMAMETMVRCNLRKGKESYLRVMRGNRIIVNTCILYGRMVLTIGISLYSTRLVLNSLGATDFGIFNLVAGIIALLSFLNTAMTTSTQRYLSYHHGRSDTILLKKIFSNSLFIHLIIGLLIVMLLEVLGIFFFDRFLNIPASRIDSARIAYHYMSFTVFFSIAIVPFIALSNAHENMLWIAIVSIIESILKLGAALLLFIVLNDKLIVYAQLTGVISLFVFLLHMLYCAHKYNESSIRKFWKIDKKLIKELSSFAGWNLFGTLCFLGRTQGLAVLLNLFFGAMINAAYAIANQVSGQLNFFSIAMLQALNPQIMKSEGEGDRQKMLGLSMAASKFGFFLLAFITIPCIFEMKQILTFWLKEVPVHTIIFCQLILLGALINQLTVGLQSALQAVGEIKMYQIVVGSIILLNLPVAFILLKNGFPAYTVFVSYSIIELFASGGRIYFIKKLTGLSIREYFLKVIIKEIIPVGISCLYCWMIIKYSSYVQYRFVYTCAISALLFWISVYVIGLEKEERSYVVEMIFKKKTK